MPKAAIAEASPGEPPVQPREALYWRRNLWVCLMGSFSTIVAMTLLLPFLPLYVEQLGVKDHAAIVQWSGIAYGATFFAAAFVAPLWGRLADLYGCKLMLLRASMGLAVAMSLTGMVHNVWQLAAVRLFAGLAGGFSSGSTVLVAMQTPRSRSGWALGTLASGVMAGSLVGPLAGGALPALVGIRQTFWLAGGIVFLTFLATAIFIKEEPRTPATGQKRALRGAWKTIPDKRPVAAMLMTGLLLMIANMSIEPIITVYVSELVTDPGRVTIMAGVVMSAAAFGGIVSASRLGKLADRAGHWNVITAGLAVSALLLIPQAFVTSAWQLAGLRFLMGLSLGGLLPCITSVIRHHVPHDVAGNILGYSITSQFAGQVLGPLAGGFAGGHFGMRFVFFGTSALMAAGAIYNWCETPGHRRAGSRKFPMPWGKRG